MDGFNIIFSKFPGLTTCLKAIRVTMPRFVVVLTDCDEDDYCHFEGQIPYPFLKKKIFSEEVQDGAICPLKFSQFLPVR